jgi:large subunit ribosomal protein L29
MVVKNIIHEMTDLELLKKVEDDRKSFNKMKLYHKVSSLDNPMQLRLKKREIAKVLTEINKRKRQ